VPKDKLKVEFKYDKGTIEFNVLHQDPSITNLNKHNVRQFVIKSEDTLNLKSIERVELRDETMYLRGYADYYYDLNSITVIHRENLGLFTDVDVMIYLYKCINTLLHFSKSHLSKGENND
jgi:hypothetical protein